MRVQPRWQVDVCQQNVCHRGRNGAEHHIPNQEFVSYRIHANKKNSNIFVSRFDFDSRCKPVVFAEQVLEWNLIFVLLSKILDRSKRLFVVQICAVIIYREIGTYTFNSFLLSLWRSQNKGDLFGSSKIDTDKSCNQLLKIVLRYNGHLHKELFGGPKPDCSIFEEMKKLYYRHSAKKCTKYPGDLAAEPILKQCAVYGSPPWPEIASKPGSSPPERYGQNNITSQP